MIVLFTGMHILSNEDTNLLQEDINAIATWASTWLMKFNVSKSCHIQFTKAKIHCINKTYYLDFMTHHSYFPITASTYLGSQILNGLNILRRKYVASASHIRIIAEKHQNFLNTYV